MTSPVLVAGSTSIGWTGGLTSNASDQLIGTESTTFPFLNAIQALDTSQNPAIIIAVSMASTGQGTAAGATLTVGGYSAQVIAECLVGDIGGSVFANVLLAVLPVTAGMVFADATTIATVPGISSGGSPFVYGGQMRTALYYNVDPTANLAWAAGFTGNSNHGGVTSVSVGATAGQLAVAAWSNSLVGGGSHYTVTGPTSDFTEAFNTGFAGVSDGYGIVGSTGTFNATATAPGSGSPDAAAIVGLIAGALPATVTVPDVVGLDDPAAQAAIVAALLTVGSTTLIIGSPPGQVTAQSPAAGTVVATGSAVNLTEYEGQLVPDVVNTSLAVVAPGLLIAAGLTVGSVSYDASGVIISGNVISQSPAAGSFVPGGSAVNLVVSSGLPALTVPDIFGLSQADAETVLTSLGLVVGAVGSAPSPFVPPGTVQTQNPSAGTPVGPGTIVSFVLSLGTPAVGTAFDFEATVISQYANSPVIMQLVQNLNQYIDQSTNFANFFNFVWNVDTAVGFGLDIWGKIVGVSRLLQIPNTTDYVGFDNGTRSPPDWQSMGSDQPPQPAVGGALYTGYNATSTYLLGDDAYRQLILAKAFANICTTTAPALNTILQNLYGPGTAWVLNTGPMAISYNLNFTPSAIQLAILEQSGVIPTPPGVSVVIVTP